MILEEFAVGKVNHNTETILSNVALETLRTYYKSVKPKDWLFPGQKKGRHISTRTVEKVFEDVIKK